MNKLINCKQWEIILFIFYKISYFKGIKSVLLKWLTLSLNNYNTNKCFRMESPPKRKRKKNRTHTIPAIYLSSHTQCSSYEWLYGFMIPFDWRHYCLMIYLYLPAGSPYLYLVNWAVSISTERTLSMCKSPNQMQWHPKAKEFQCNSTSIPLPLARC